MLALRCIVLEKHCRHKYAAKLLQKSLDLYTTNTWIAAELVRELAAEDIGEFQVTFRMSSDK